MGAIYSEKFVKVQSPRVALANIGTEDSKGDRLRHEAFDLLKDTKEINFIGNVETRDVPTAAATCSSRTASRAILS